MNEKEREKKRERERERARNGSGEKSCIEDEGGPISRTGWGCSSSFSAFDHARKVRRRDTTRPSSRFIFTDYRTLDDCKLECNSSSASMDLSSVSGPPLSATDSFRVNECRASSFSVR